MNNNKKTGLYCIVAGSIALVAIYQIAMTTDILWLLLLCFPAAFSIAYGLQSTLPKIPLPRFYTERTLSKKAGYYCIFAALAMGIAEFYIILYTKNLWLFLLSVPAGVLLHVGIRAAMPRVDAFLDGFAGDGTYDDNNNYYYQNNYWRRAFDINSANDIYNNPRNPLYWDD